MARKMQGMREPVIHAGNTANISFFLSGQTYLYAAPSAWTIIDETPYLPPPDHLKTPWGKRYALAVYVEAGRWTSPKMKAAEIVQKLKNGMRILRSFYTERYGDKNWRRMIAEGEDTSPIELNVGDTIGSVWEYGDYGDPNTLLPQPMKNLSTNK